MSDENKTTQQIELDSAKEDAARAKRDENRLAYSRGRVVASRDQCSPDAHKALSTHVLNVGDLVEEDHAAILDIKGNVQTIAAATNTMSSQFHSFTTELKRTNDKNGNGYVIQKGVFKGIPVRYLTLGAIVLGCAALICGTLLLIYALGQNKVDQLVHAAKVLRGTAEKAEAIQLANGRERPE